MWIPEPLRAAMVACLLPGAALAEAPLSAIDWLSQSVAAPEAATGMPVALPLPRGRAPDISTGAGIDPVTTAPILGPGRGASLDALGLLSPAVTGLPRDLWGTTPSIELARLIRAERIDTLPAIQALLITLLLAELDPPADANGTGALYLARVDKLLDLGALEPAQALLDLPATPQPEPFRRWFDAALLLGEEDRACHTMRASPQVAPTFPARIFCLARGGDWNAAALSLRTGEALGFIEPEMAELLTRFLDPDAYEGEPDMVLPQRPSPLVLRMLEAIGQPMPTGSLPVAFAHADLRSNSGWKTRLEAAERLARVGAIDPNRLLALYSERRRAASGGVWERVEAIQRFDVAITARDPNAVAITLPAVWALMVEAELEVPFAALYGERLADLSLDGAAERLAFRVGLLSEGYEKIAARHQPADGIEAFLIGVARGDVTALAPPDQMGGAIKRAFAGAPAPGDDVAALLSEKRLGEALLVAIDKVTEGAKGDLRDVTTGLAILRAVGLESTARRAALELLLLERRG